MELEFLWSWRKSLLAQDLQGQEVHNIFAD